MERRERRKQPISSFAEPCLKQEFLNFEDIACTKVFLIPKIHLYGIQPKEAYSPGSRRQVEKLLQKDNRRGYLTLLQNPTLAIPLFSGNNAFVAITDGHLRARYTDRTKVPVRIIPLHHAANIFNRHSTHAITESQLADDLIRSMSLSQRSFDNMPEEKRPLPVFNTKNIQEFFGKFEELPNFTPSFIQGCTQELVLNEPFAVIDEAREVLDSEERKRNFFDNMNA